MSSHYFQGNKEHPQHISVGGIVVNDQKQICAHKFHEDQLAPYLEGENIGADVYLLMRETVDPNESLENAFHRGLMEEFGIKAKLFGG